MDFLKTLKEHPYISDSVTLNIYKEPYSYAIIDNLFKPDIYEKICKRSPEYIARQPAQAGEVGDSGKIYNAIIYTITKKEDLIDGFDFFNSKSWQNFVSNLFDIKLNQHNALSLHWHKGSPESPSKDGWPHADLGICSAIDDPSIPIKIIGDCDYGEDSYDRQPNTTKIIKSVAILYYFNNKTPLEPNDGGGTAVCEDKKILEIKPLNNRVFLFEISPKSFHRFIAAKFDRTAIVHWFHSSPSYIVKRHEALFRERYKKGNDFFEFWKKGNRWQLDMDPDYYDYFNLPFDQEFKR
jgi:hypothetical protein